MDRCSNSGESSQRRERVRRKKIKVREKVEMCGSGGSKSRLAKAAGAEPSGEMRDEQLHAVVAPSRFGSQNVKNILGSVRSRALLEVQMLKKCTPLWRKAHFEVESVKN